jgi:hypothetical protein
MPVKRACGVAPSEEAAAGLCQVVGRKADGAERVSQRWQGLGR